MSEALSPSDGLLNTLYPLFPPYWASNRRLVTVLSSHGHLEQIESQAIEVGDVVRLVENDVVPADLVVLSTSHEHGQGRRA